MKTVRDCYSRFALVSTLAVFVTASLALQASAARWREKPAQGSSDSQTQPQATPQTRPRPGKPSDGPSTQPVKPPRPNPGKPGPPPRPNPGRPTPGRPNPGRPNPGRPNPGRPNPGRPNPGRPPGVRPRPPYNFRPGDNDRLRRYYRRNFGYINRSRRPIFVIGGYIPFGDRGYFRPVPPHLLGYLPAVPPGYAIGYFDGYCVVYDPVSFAILSFVDLLS